MGNNTLYYIVGGIKMSSRNCLSNKLIIEVFPDPHFPKSPITNEVLGLQESNESHIDDYGLYQSLSFDVIYNKPLL